MLRNWQFWGSVLGIGALSFFSGLAGRWAEDPDPAFSYSDERTWAILVGTALMALGLAGTIYCAAFVRETKERMANNVHVESRNQRGGITAHTVKLGKKGVDHRDEEG